MTDAAPSGTRTVTTDWTAPRRGHWRRDFRLGEWLTAPVTPSFATWFLPQAEAGFDDVLGEQWAMHIDLPLHVLINGWYYTNPGHPHGMAAQVLKHPVQWARLFGAIATMTSHPERLEHHQAEPSLDGYERQLWPAHRKWIERASDRVEDASPAELVAIVDELSRSTGTLMMPLVEAAGFASKAEAALATFYDRHLRATVGGTHLSLLIGLVEPSPPPGHAVRNLDWVDPTEGEAGMLRPAVVVDHAALVDRRVAAETACRAALDGRRRRRFDTTLAVAQRWVPHRERLSNNLTSAWPVLRRALLRLGGHLVAGGIVTRADDVFFLERDEVVAGAAGDDATPRADLVAERRDRRRAQSLLSPPLGVGKLSTNFRMAEKLFPRYRSGDVGAATATTLVGLPSSPGHATGRARVVRGVDDFERFEPGDVLVAPVTAPGWEALMAVAVAVVTDGGSVFAHASVIAREYGIPCVVGTGDATTVLVDGETVTVDGERGVVERGVVERGVVERVG